VLRQEKSGSPAPFFLSLGIRDRLPLENYSAEPLQQLLSQKKANLPLFMKSVKTARVARFFFVQNTKTEKYTKFPRTIPNVRK
jgi:hypothetical protein